MKTTMHTRKSLFGILCLASLALALAANATARTHADAAYSDLGEEKALIITPAADRGHLQLADGGISASEAASAAQRRHGGKVLKVSRSGAVFRVKLLLDSGKVIIVTVDAQTGRVK